MISDFWAHYHCACAQMAIWEHLGPDLQRIVTSTYELLMTSGTYDNFTTTAEGSLENLTLQLKTKTRCSTQNYHMGSVCLLFSDVERIWHDSFYNDVNYSCTECYLISAVQRDPRASIHRIFQCLKQIMITRLLTDSNPRSHRGRGQRSTSRITSFRSINIPVVISHYLFYFESNRRLTDSI